MELLQICANVKKRTGTVRTGHDAEYKYRGLFNTTFRFQHVTLILFF